MDIKSENFNETLKGFKVFEAQRAAAIAELVSQREKLDEMIDELEALGGKKKEKPAERKCGKCGRTGHSSRKCEV